MNSLKNKLYLVLVVLATFTLSVSAQKETKEIIIDKSVITWKAYKVLGSHFGEVSFKSGSLEFSDKKLTGGSFVADMTSISVKDLEGDYKKKLEGHLKSEDFFSVEKFTTTSLKMTKITPKGKNSYTVVADLTIKGKTNPISFEASIYGSKATATLKVDRTLYDIQYGSTGFFENLGDKAIYDEFDLVVDIQF